MTYHSKFIIVFIIFLTSLCEEIKPQIGINKQNPDTSSVLDIYSTKKGVLFPRIESVEILDKKDALFFYNNTKKKFYYYNGYKESWQCINPFDAEDPDDITAPRNLSVLKKLTADTIHSNQTIEANKNIKTTNGSFTGRGAVPIGSIIMWSGDPNNLPDGWALCDGKNNTPDLRGRFIVGYSNSYGTGNENETFDTNYSEVSSSNFIYEKRMCLIDPISEEMKYYWEKVEHCDTTNADCRILKLPVNKRFNTAVNNSYNEIGLNAGKTYHMLKPKELPAHDHQVNIETNQSGEHSHGNNAPEKKSKKVGKNSGKGEKAQDHGASNATINNNGVHTHMVEGNTESTGASQAHENRPPYYVLAFIIRVY